MLLSICDGNWSWQNLFIYHIKYFISSFALDNVKGHSGRDKVEGGWKIIRIDQCQDGIASKAGSLAILSFGMS